MGEWLTAEFYAVDFSVSIGAGKIAACLVYKIPSDSGVKYAIGILRAVHCMIWDSTYYYGLHEHLRILILTGSSVCFDSCYRNGIQPGVEGRRQDEWVKERHTYKHVQYIVAQCGTISAPRLFTTTANYSKYFFPSLKLVFIYCCVLYKSVLVEWCLYLFR